MFEHFRDALFYEINVIDDYEQRRKAIKVRIDMLVEEYGKTCLREENDKQVSEIVEKYRRARAATDRVSTLAPTSALRRRNREYGTERGPEAPVHLQTKGQNGLDRV